MEEYWSDEEYLGAVLELSEEYEVKKEILDKILDDAPEEWEDLHVFPVDDLLEHNTDSGECMCDPEVEVAGGKLLIIHNAYDGRL